MHHHGARGSADKWSCTSDFSLYTPNCKSVWPEVDQDIFLLCSFVFRALVISVTVHTFPGARSVETEDRCLLRGAQEAEHLFVSPAVPAFGPRGGEAQRKANGKATTTDATGGFTLLATCAGLRVVCHGRWRLDHVPLARFRSAIVAHTHERRYAIEGSRCYQSITEGTPSKRLCVVDSNGTARYELEYSVPRSRSLLAVWMDEGPDGGGAVQFSWNELDLSYREVSYWPLVLDMLHTMNVRNGPFGSENLFHKVEEAIDKLTTVSSKETPMFAPLCIVETRIPRAHWLRSL